MTSTQQLPSLKLPEGDGGLRISISFFPNSDADHPDASDSAAAGPDGRVSDRRSIVQAQSPGPPLTPTSHNIPIHPIPSLQDAFTESLDEVTNGNVADKPKLAQLDARARRERLLAQDKDAEPFDVTWRYRPGQQQHELFKLLAQISFGVYLLLNGMANSNAQVINILQGHIDEVDEYLEITLEDLGQALTDLTARIDHLKLPLSKLGAFEELLEDRSFRCGILEANEKIDHILSRTDIAMKQWDNDIDAGLQCTAAFTSWLNDQRDAEWRTQRPDVADVFDAMKGNAEGWLLAFDDIHDRAQEVNNLLIRLMTVIAEMEKKAGEVSRRTWSDPRQPHRQQSSIRSVSSSGVMPGVVDDTDARGVVPPVPPFLPSRSMARHAPNDSVDSRQSRRQTSAPSTSSLELGSLNGLKEGGRLDSSTDESLYVLQPRIYSPRTPEQLPSPALNQAANITPKPEQRRMSLKSIVPDDIHIPPRSVADASIPRPSSKYATPRSTASQPFDSAYCSDTEAQSLQQGSHAGSEASLSPPVRPHMVHSPRSDHLQYYRPVEASPHSPLQQRPHTAMGPRASQFSSHQMRNQPSQLGSVRTPSDATLGAYDGAVTPTGRSHGEGKSLKKKKSTFGWFKKAFSLDEEERAEFEARKARSQMDRYYDGNSPRFLDGRRIR
ncbi:hypothetical protein HRG_001226 [Hirsutella rhossiliensis]|uniref:Uncharacterized protein n=1 Tax=Hirsutella rhossiliensis TaxID=111463 RepID=A0A9P8SNN3_9HYPO|nr:uncharacterized protein HRG_01226 [Hirsutella rhossiliensis]KAH0968584.1 hypothetical protein HRG_01226 [Hirsutella rhossiliensis]